MPPLGAVLVCRCYAMDAGTPRVDAQSKPTPAFSTKPKSSLGLAPFPLWQLVHLTGAGNKGLARLPQAYVDDPRAYLLERTADARRLGLPVVISRPYGDEPAGYRTGYRVGEVEGENDPLKRLDLTWPHSRQILRGSLALIQQLGADKVHALISRIDEAILYLTALMPAVIVYVGPPPLEMAYSYNDKPIDLAACQRPMLRRTIATSYLSHDMLCSTPDDRRAPLYCYDNTAMSDPTRPTLSNLVLGELFDVEPLTHGVEGNMRHTDDNVRRWNPMPFGFMAMTLDRLRTAEREQSQRVDALLTPRLIRNIFRAWTLTLVIGDAASPTPESRVAAVKDVISEYTIHGQGCCAACAVGGLSPEQWTELAAHVGAGG